MSTIHPAFWLVIAGVLLTLTQRACRMIFPSTTPKVTKEACHIKVLIACKPDQPWQECLWHLITRASSPQNLRFRVMLRCSTLHDADVALDSALRRHARVSYVPRGQHDGSAGDLVAHFVRGDERYVCVVDSAARVVVGWDRDLVPSERRVMLSCCVPKEQGSACFPVLARDGRRGKERSFVQPARVFVPSVAWCAELSIASPSVWKEWVENGKEPWHHVPAFPILHPFEPVGNDTPPPSSSSSSSSPSYEERVGLTRHAGDVEKIAKYGSARAARLAVEFAKEDGEA